MNKKEKKKENCYLTYPSLKFPNRKDKPNIFQAWPQLIRYSRLKKNSVTVCADRAFVPIRLLEISWMDPEGGRGSGPPFENQVAMCLLRNNGTDPPREAIGPLGSNCYLREVRKALCKIC